ncbi:MAG: helix-turn-helix domain-containing protein [Betaproteobacteria bacterium]
MSYRQMTLYERFAIYQLHLAQFGVRKIARRLNRDHSTNLTADPYCAWQRGSNELPAVCCADIFQGHRFLGCQPRTVPQ